MTTFYYTDGDADFTSHKNNHTLAGLCHITFELADNGNMLPLDLLGLLSEKQQLWKEFWIGNNREDVSNCVFIMNDIFRQNFPEFIGGFAVKPNKICMDGMQGIQSFSVYAFLKSISKNELEDLFICLYSDTEYCTNMVAQLKTADAMNSHLWNENIGPYNEMYEAVANALSFHVAKSFAFTLKTYGLDASLKVCFDGHINNDALRNVLEEMFFESGDCNLAPSVYEEEVFRRIYLYHGFTLVDKRLDMLSQIKRYGVLGQDLKTISLFCISLLGDKHKGHLTLSEIQDAVKMVCGLKDEDALNLTIVALCHLSSQNIIFEYVKCNVARNVVERGYKLSDGIFPSMIVKNLFKMDVIEDAHRRIISVYGNESTFPYGIAGKIFYISVIAYVGSVAKEWCIDRYGKFLYILKDFLLHNSMIGLVVSMDEFYIYGEMFRERLEEFYDEDIVLNIGDDEPYYIRRIYAHIKSVDWNK